MIPVGKALNRGRSIITMPVGRLATKMQFRNRTAVLWSRSFATGGVVSQKHKAGEIVKRGKEAKLLSQKSVIKWVVLTGVTIALGTVILNSQITFSPFIMTPKLLNN